MPRQSRMFTVGPVATIVLLCAFMACGNSWAAKNKRASDRGFRFPHDTHLEQGMDCEDCHLEEPGEPKVPDHEFCSLCHDNVVEETEELGCDMCHTRSDQSLDPLPKSLIEDIGFSHIPHIDKGVACTTCHEDPDRARLPKGPLMDFCRECHRQEEARLQEETRLTECDTCHQTIRQDLRPTFRGKARIMHDVPGLWERAHGHEYKVDPEFCARCHEEEGESCEQCHRMNPPSYHTLSWRRKTHGLRAARDRSTCAVCHEEDSCLRCHQNTEPTSHRAGWGSPRNRHCVSCHFPEQNNRCTVCHESIEHPRAMPSPHVLAVYPENCALCHPGGQPHRAPHPQNSTVHCLVCHQW